MGSMDEFIIPFSSLKDGKNLFKYYLNNKFFEAFEFEEIDYCNITVKTELFKTSSLLDMQFYIEGSYISVCDRCLADVELNINNQFRQIVKFVEDAEYSEYEEIKFLSNNEYELNIAPYVFENCLLSLPLKKVHNEGECDKNSIKVLNKYLLKEPNKKSKSETENTDPRWNKLKTLYKKTKKN